MLFKILFQQQNWELVTTKTFDKKLDNFSYTVIKNKKFRKAIFCFSGSKSKEQIFKQIKNSSGMQYKKEFPYIKIMKYFLKLYNSIEKDLKKILFDIKKDKEIDQFIFTGHSLGGAIASVAVFDIMQEGLIPKTDNSPVLYTFGQPRTGNYAFSNELMKKVPIVFRIANNFDPVVLIPSCKVQGKRCITEFGKYELDSNFDGYEKVYENLSSDEKKRFYPFHIGGLILVKGENEILDCTDKSEPASNDKCKGEFSLNIGYHRIYFGYRISRIVKPENFPYGKEEDFSLESVAKKKNIWKDFKSNKLLGFFSKVFKGLDGFGLFHF